MTKFELVRVNQKVTDGKVIIKGPDLKDMEKGSRHPIGIFVEVAGSQLEEDLEAVFERRIHEFCNFVNGIMHLNQRYTNWMRISIQAFEKGLNSFEMLGTILIRLFKAELPIIEKAQVTFYTSDKEIAKPHDMAMGVYNARDERARGLHDDDVDMFMVVYYANHSLQLMRVVLHLIEQVYVAQLIGLMLVPLLKWIQKDLFSK